MLTASNSNSLEAGSGIDLAREPDFAIGRLTIRPSLRQLIRADDGAEALVEPRIMQVLVALARAQGGIVTRDDLVRDCWDGRIVGEDAINRALSKVRKLSEGIGSGSFALETITRIGYRLVIDRGGEHPEARVPPRRVSRRWLIGGAAAAAACAGTAALLLSGRPQRQSLPPEVAPLMQQAEATLRQQTREGHNQAIGLLQRVVEDAPGSADGWGALAHAYALAAFVREPAEGDALRARARAAARRALALDPDNGYAEVALATARPLIGNWLAIETALRHALVEHGANPNLLLALASLLGNVGRFSDSLPLTARVVTLQPPTPDVYYMRVRALWSLNRMEEADRLMDEAASLYPTQFAIWFMRFYTLMFSGRASAAIAMAADRRQRPTGIPDEEFDSVVRVAQAIDSGDPSKADAVLAEQMQRARRGSGYAENALQFAVALGRFDLAFAIADAYYFDRGFVVPDVRFTREQGTYSARRDRATNFLFMPSSAKMRSDRRFDRLIGEIGLERYWRDSGSSPDYRG